MTNRCKNCRLWREYKGSEPTMPRRSPRACMLRLHTMMRDDEIVMVPSVAAEDPKGPRWGERTKPNDSCKYFTANKPPAIRVGKPIPPAPYGADTST